MKLGVVSDILGMSLNFPGICTSLIFFWERSQEKRLGNIFFSKGRLLKQSTLLKIDVSHLHSDFELLSKLHNSPLNETAGKLGSQGIKGNIKAKQIVATVLTNSSNASQKV